MCCASRLVRLRALNDARILLYFSGNSEFSATVFLRSHSFECLE